MRGTCTVVAVVLFSASNAVAAEVARTTLFGVAELAFKGPHVTGADRPTTTIDLSVRLQHESGSPAYTIAGFWDGGDSWRMRFAPTKTGTWSITEVKTNRPFSGPKVGDVVVATTSKLHGFWTPSPTSPRRNYQRSDGTHPSIVGNTHYDFLFAPLGAEATRASIEKDVADNAPMFNKLRFCLMQPRNENRSALKPFLEGDAATDAETDQPNPAFFRDRVDVAVAKAFEHDVIADLIMGGTVGDQVASKPGFLAYVAARYGSYPNVWITIGQEWNEQVSAAYEVDIGTKLRSLLPYATPLSTHAVAAWHAELNGAWNDHSIRQHKIESMSSAAGDMGKDFAANGGKPPVNDENGYDPGESSTEDVVEGITGTFLGGGYGSTGHKTESKAGGYFWGHAARGKTIAEHPSAAPLGFLRRTVDKYVRFWRATPGRAEKSVFGGGDNYWPTLVWEGEQHTLGSNASRAITVTLPAGAWRVQRVDVLAQREETVAVSATGKLDLTTPASRAGLTIVTRIGGAADGPSEITPMEPTPTKPPPSMMPPPPAVDQKPVVTTTSDELDGATVGKAYADDVEAEGGDAPLGWKATGLPPGLRLDAGGALEGTPTEAGTFTFTVTVADADGDAATQMLELRVSPASGGSGGASAGASEGTTGGAGPRGGGAAGRGASTDVDAATGSSGCAFGGSGSASGGLLLLLAALFLRRQRVARRMPPS